MAPGDWVVRKAAGVTGELSDEKKPSRQTRTARAQIQRQEAA